MKDREIKATLRAQTAMLIALAHVTAEPGKVKKVFGALISHEIENESDPQTGGSLRTLEEAYLGAIGKPSHTMNSSLPLTALHHG